MALSSHVLRRVCAACLALTAALVCILWPAGRPAALTGRLLAAIDAPLQRVGDLLLDAEPQIRSAASKEDFERWMAEAGMSLPSNSNDLSDFGRALIVRILLFCHDVLPNSVMRQYSEEFSALADAIPVNEARSLTKTEKAIQEALEHEGELLKQQEADELPTAASPNYNYFSFLPDYMGRAVPGGKAVTWESSCWKSVTATSQKVSGGWELQVSVSGARQVICFDLYGFATASGLTAGVFPTPVGGTKKFVFKDHDLADSDIWDADTLGVRIFRFKQSALKIVKNVLETALLFVPVFLKVGTGLTSARNIDFLTNYRGLDLKPRDDKVDVMLNESEINSGDFLGILRLDGLDPMLAWGMGSRTGHTAVAVWEDKQLYVAESTTNGTYWPVNGIQRTPYRQWLKQARAANYNVVHVPLAQKYRAVFDAKAANAFFHAHETLDYGFHGLLTGWIDSDSKNYPCKPPYDASPEDKQCLVWEMLEVLVPFVTRFLPSEDKIFLPNWNQHVTGSSTTGLSATQLYRMALQKGLKLADIPAVVEKDSNVYPMRLNNGTLVEAMPMVCDVFVCMMWKAGGVFKEINDDFNCVEQTNIDIYDLEVVQAPEQRPPQCVEADPENELCQLMGKQKLLLPKVGTRKMYKHMQDHCPTEPPLYERPDDC
eukprot:TRINITY_DN16561_c0_g1_i1.p1 TRINITY_DN16561_c0_g1~~TRINITY_DN16561_c0_g1_i1.p1  ORF type:complete len:691 (-),score=165.32 TRINITY_DN16561_c0_g1_i1:431-2404(-)